MRTTSVYVIAGGDFSKIGIAENPKLRCAQLATGNPHDLDLMFTAECSSREHARKVERLAHASLHDLRVAGEWFDCSPWTAIDAVKHVMQQVA